MKQSEESFYNSTINKVCTMMELYLDYKLGNKQENNIIECNDMNDFL